jgi:hypothetical protein
MAKGYTELGVVVKVFDSGVVKTDKDFHTSFTAQIGDKLRMDNSTKKISIVTLRQKLKNSNKDTQTVSEDSDSDIFNTQNNEQK